MKEIHDFFNFYEQNFSYVGNESKVNKIIPKIKLHFPNVDKNLKDEMCVTII